MRRSYTSFGGRATLLIVSAALAASLLSWPAADLAAAAGTPPEDTPAADVDIAVVADPRPAELSASQASDLLGESWETSTDFSWSLAGDSTGLHVVVAHARDAYRPTTVATLTADGVETDRWVGNGCLASDSSHLVVSYAPRAFTNDQDLFLRGALVAVVDLRSGTVTHSPARSSLEYFTPACGLEGEAVVTASGGDALLGTLLTVVDASTGDIRTQTEVDLQATSAVPTRSGLVAAVGRTIVRVEDDGTTTALASTGATAFDLTADADGGVVFVDHDGEDALVGRLPAELVGGGGSDEAISPFARAPLTDVGITATPSGVVSVTGNVQVSGAVPAPVDVIAAPANATVTAEGGAFTVLDGVTPAAAAVDLSQVTTADLTIVAPDGGREVEIRGEVGGVVGSSPLAAASSATSRSAGASIAARPAGDPHDPVDADRTCSVPRNDVENQALQPKPRQVEWAVNRAVTDTLDIQRPANWNNLGMSAYTPQALFPLVALDGGGRIPSQVLLGVLAQESNLWQASGSIMPGMTGNPLTGNFYGFDRDASTDLGRWDVTWDRADCGYGVGQITDRMRLPEYNDTSLPSYSYAEQRAIALDYTVNIALAARMLAQKWNETRAAGLVINDGNPARIENWFFAVWAYNSGFYPEAAQNADGRNGAWGVGWANNPANPSYDPTRERFMFAQSDATHPQDWPYPEKIMGWAATPPTLYEAPNTPVAGYRAAWWLGTDPEANRENSKPPVHAFCTSANDCVPGTEQIGEHPDVDGYSVGPCQHRDSLGRYDGRCWYHEPVVWKTSCDSECGRELLRFTSEYMAEQANGNSYPPVCSRAGLPAGTLVIDDLQADAPMVRPGCNRSSVSAGTFQFTFPSINGGEYPAKADLHQIGGGYDGHFWFGHARTEDIRGGSMEIQGTWTLDRSLQQWTRVLIHLPDVGAHSQDARYTVSFGDGGSSTRTLPQRVGTNQWVPIGVFPIDGVPSVTLTTESWTGDGARLDENDQVIVTNQDVAFDAVAFEPLSAKPSEFVVALGDSYSSGEGGSVTGGGDYYSVSDNFGSNPNLRNACHRSRYTWSRVAFLPGATSATGTRSDALDPTLDYHLIACSGARTYNVMAQYTEGGASHSDVAEHDIEPIYGEPTQIDQGYLDENTTLVTMSIGGNDAGFSEIIMTCILNLDHTCDEHIFPGEDQPLSSEFPRRVAERVRPSVVETLRQIHARAPNARILLMGYPEVISGPGIPMIDDVEIEFTQQMVVTLNTGLAQAATIFNNEIGSDLAAFADPVSTFGNTGIGGSPEYIHGIVTAKTPGDETGLYSAQSFHPKIDGHAMYALVLEQRLMQLGW